MLSHGIRSLSFFLRAIAVGALAANAAPQTWGVQYGTSTMDHLGEIVPDGQGGTFCAGDTGGSLAGPHMGSSDVFVVRSAAGGGQVWARQLGTSGWDEIGGIAPDGAGGLFVAGTTEGSFTPTSGGKDGFLARLDGQGNLLWAVNAGTGQWDFFEAVVADGSGGALGIGKTFLPIGFGVYHLWIVRFDGAGAVQSASTYPSLGGVALSCAVSDGSSGFFVGGWSTGGTNTAALVARFTPTANLMWSRILNSPQGDFVQGVALDGAGGLFAVGRTLGALGTAQGGEDAFVARFDAAGNDLWLRQFGTPADDDASNACSDGFGGVMVTGFTGGDLAGTLGGALDAWVMRFDAGGDATWSQQLSGPAADYGLAVCNAAPLEFVATGSTTGNLFGTHAGFGTDAWIAGFEACSLQPPTTYCVASPNSTGQGARMGHLGSPDLSDNDFTLTVAGCPAGQIGLFLLGPGQKSIPFGDGVLCLGGGVFRLHPALFTDVAGSASITLDVTDPSSSASQIDAGETWNFQFWYRDPASAGAGFNLSNGLSATFCP